MNDEEFNRTIKTIAHTVREASYYVEAISKLIDETRRLRKLVQCCERDNDYDGNCKFHGGKINVSREF